MNRNVKLKDASLYKSDDSNSWYLHLIYTYENDRGIYERHYNKLLLPLESDVLPSVSIDRFTDYIPLCHLGFADLMAYRDKDGCFAKDVFVEKKIHKMTLKEIEDKLGYNIELVSEKEKE